MNSTQLAMAGPNEMARALAGRVRALRLLRGWTQATLAQRAGVTTASYRRFERTGKASFDLVLKVAHTLARMEGFEGLFNLPIATSIAELEKRTTAPTPKRGRT